MRESAIRAVTLALFVSVVLFSVVAAEDEGQPNAVIEETAVDLGEIYEQPSYTHQFKIKNTGNAKLYVTKVKPGCGCTVAEFDEVVLPGEEGTITLEVAGSKVDGTWRKSATVHTNDPSHSRMTISLGASVINHVTVEPSKVYLRGMHGEAVSATVDVSSVEMKKDLEIVSVSSNADDKMTYEIVPDAEPGHYSIKLYKNPKLPTVNTWGTLFIKTNSEKTPDKSVQVNVVTRGSIVVQPSSVNFGAVTASNTDGVEKSIIVTKLTGDFQIHNVSFSDGAYKADVEPIEDGKKYRIRVKFHPDVIEKKSYVDEMIINTDDPQEPAIRVRMIAEGVI